ncbi:MAG: hypothetical protein H6634_03420 [Anaerolineales bacterium]|nr:hypothetical protein [Anaerolineales bacterium]
MGEDFQKRFFSLSIIGLTSKPLSLAVIEDLAQVVTFEWIFSFRQKSSVSAHYRFVSYAQPGERGRRVLIYQKQHDLGGKVLGITVATWVIYYFLNNIIPSNGGMETTSV